MIIRNLDDGSTQWVPDRTTPLNPAPTPEVVVPAWLLEPMRVAPPRQFPPLTGPLYARQPRIKVQTYLLAWAIIIGGLIAVLTVIGLVFG
jgi:hypothetical protein